MSTRKVPKTKDQKWCRSWRCLSIIFRDSLISPEDPKGDRDPRAELARRSMEQSETRGQPSLGGGNDLTDRRSGTRGASRCLFVHGSPAVVSQSCTSIQKLQYVQWPFIRTWNTVLPPTGRKVRGTGYHVPNTSER